MSDKQARKDSQKKQENKDTIVTIAIAVLAIVTVIALIFFLKKSPENDQANEPISGEQVEINLSDSEHEKGPKTASVTVVEYGDFQCPACQFQAPLIKQLHEDFPDDVRVVFRHLPLTPIHNNAMRAARATEAASRQGKFFEMHDLIYEKQEDWSETDNALDSFKEYAKELGLDESQFESDLEDKSLDDKIDQDVKSAETLNVESTPTIFVNGTQIPSPASYGVFKEIIETAITDTKSEPETTTEEQEPASENDIESENSKDEEETTTDETENSKTENEEPTVE